MGVSKSFSNGQTPEGVQQSHAMFEEAGARHFSRYTILLPMLKSTYINKCMYCWRCWCDHTSYCLRCILIANATVHVHTDDDVTLACVASTFSVQASSFYPHTVIPKPRAVAPRTDVQRVTSGKKGWALIAHAAPGLLVLRLALVIIFTLVFDAARFPLHFSR